MSREKQNDCLHYDKEFNCCKVLSDWGQPMPVLQPCVESPCEYYEPCDANKEKLLINDLKSNNSEDMRNEQIAEMARDLHITNDCAEYFMNSLGYRKQEWISVDERLPPEEKRNYLCTDGSFVGIVYYYSKKLGFEDYAPFDKITHWMPLPEAPKMKGGAE